MPKDVLLVVDYLDSIDIETLCDYVYCIDGHGAANHGLFVGGVNASSTIVKTVQRARFDDSASVVNNTNELITEPTSHE